MITLPAGTPPAPADDFVRRHVGPDDDELGHMLDTLGVDTLDALLDETLPESIRDDTLDLPAARSEPDVLAALRRLAAENAPRTSLIGMGYYPTVTPGVIQRNVLENPAWYTAYTPYQPEISQGRLEALLNFQTTITELTGLEVANSSLLDEATAAAEAMSMARRLSKSTSARFFVHHDTHPQTIAVLATRAEPVGIELVVGDVDELAAGCFGALFSSPTSTGAIVDWRDHAAAVHEQGGLVVDRHRPAGMHAARSPGDARRRHRRRLGPALRRADGLRRPARRVHQRPRHGRPGDARPDRRREHGHRGPAGPPPRPADARAAHPPRTGHLEHLYGSGPARQHRRAVRLLARSRRPAGHRLAGASAGVVARARRCAPAASRSATSPASTP